MNIKGLTPQVMQIEPRPRVEGKTNVRTQNSGDRDGNGRREQAEPEIKRHLSDDEFENALKIIRENPGVLANNFQIRVEATDSGRVVFLEDVNGHVIRRLSEADLWLVTREKDRPTGKILDKAG